jgi:simple sugar transport system substrate-binding protein
MKSTKTGFKLLALSVTMVAMVGSAQAAGRYVLISHAPDSDSWWNTIKNSVKQAGEDYGVTVD